MNTIQEIKVPTFEQLPVYVAGIHQELLGLKSLFEEFKETQEKKSTNKTFTDKQLQERLGVSRITLWEWRKKGLLKYIRIGNMIRYTEEDIQEFLDKTAKE